MQEQRAREEERQQREQEYAASLEADMRKEREAAAAREAARLEAARQASLAEAARQEAEKAAAAVAEAARAAESRREARKRAREQLPPEPAAGTPGTTSVRVRLPDGSVVTRRFLRSATCAELFDWLQSCAQLEPLDDAWSLALPALHPRPIEGGLLPTDETLAELDLCGVTLFVQDEAT